VRPPKGDGQHVPNRRRSRPSHRDAPKALARVLEADIELLRRAYGESIVEEALRLADQAARQASEAPQELPPESDERASAVAEALNRLMDGR
jgi:predicted ArsR family transcriptional regulator